MTGDWLAPDALIVPVDYATYLRRGGRARRGALPGRRPRPVPGQQGRRPVRRLPRPNGDARRGDPGRHAAAGDGSCGRDASRGGAGGRRPGRRDRRACRGPRPGNDPPALTGEPRGASATCTRTQRGRPPRATLADGRVRRRPSRRSPCASSSGPSAWCSWWCWSRSSRSPASSSGSRPGRSRRRAGRPRSRVSAADVTVVRDATGIAHITATSIHDLFVAQGYVHASERMWQMEVWRHDLGRPARRGVRARPARYRQVHPNARLA